ncbi:hypothetical protein Hanom_Chr08g00751591 [Helianthus anomalus]
MVSRIQPLFPILQARIKMAYKAKDVGFECPTWPVDSWVAKLKDLEGNPLPYLAKSGAGEPLKAAEATVEAREKVEAGADAGGDGAKKVGVDAAT